MIPPSQIKTSQQHYFSETCKTTTIISNNLPISTHFSMETFNAQSDHVNATTPQIININICSEAGTQRGTLGAKPAGRRGANTVNTVV